MAGGQGTRFWPLSRRSRPKQFLSVMGRRTLLQETIARLDPLLKSRDIFVCCGTAYQRNVSEQVPGLPSQNLILEPMGRSTAPCIGLAAAQIQERLGDVSMAVLPADHIITQQKEFHQALRAATELAEQGWLVTFGIRPSSPATGYGYIGQGDEIGQFAGMSAHQAVEFIEKPSLQRATTLVTGGSHFWNSGIFVWKTSVILENIERFLPQLSALLKDMAGRWGDGERLTAGFSQLESTSIDHGVMERAERVAMLPCDLGWSDVGNWQALGQLLPRDESGNATSGLIVQRDAADCVVHGGQKLVALLGVSNLIVVDTPDVLLICEADRAEEVKSIVERLQQEDQEQFL